MRTRSSVSDDIGDRPDAAEIVLAKLRAMIAAGAQETDTILGTIAVAAHALSGAGGAAIAMPRDGEVVCVGRSGETAPMLGIPLNINSGISGECLRTGRILRCDDAARDPLVNPEVCRQMGVQSIAVVPLRGNHGRVGVLEVFSGQSYAFTEEHMELLGRLAGLAEAAWARGPGTDSPATQIPVTQDPVAEYPAAEPQLQAEPPAHVDLEPVDLEPGIADSPVVRSRVATTFAAGLDEERQAERKWRYGTMAALVALLLLLSAIGWKIWYRASLPSGSTGPARSPRESPTAPADVGAGMGLTFKPGSAPVVSRGSKVAAARSWKSRVESEAPDTVIRRNPQIPQASDQGTANPPAPADSTPAVDAPQIAAAAGPTDLAGVFARSPTMPRLSTPISQGIAGGTLLHKVQPVYPPEARRLRLEGTVILEATITERGQIENLKVISGHSVLALAATDAVSKWRYSPYLLNGKPISKLTRINISFIAP